MMCNTKRFQLIKILYIFCLLEVVVVPDIIFLNVNETVQVTVLDDGLPVTEDINITITLIQVSSTGTFDTFYDEATLIIPASRGDDNNA